MMMKRRASGPNCTAVWATEKKSLKDVGDRFSVDMKPLRKVQGQQTQVCILTLAIVFQIGGPIVF